MADISSFLTAIQTAVYGEEVRESIVNAIEAISKDGEEKIKVAKSYAEEAKQIADNVEENIHIFDDDVEEIGKLEQNINSLLSKADEVLSSISTNLKIIEDYVNDSESYAKKAEEVVSDIIPSNFGRFPISSIMGDENNDPLIDRDGNVIDGVVYLICT